MPHTSFPDRVPLRHASHHPAQVLIWARIGVSVDPTILHLREMALEEVDLVLIVWVWSIRVRSHHTKVVVDLALVDSGGGLRDKLSTPHIGVPFCGRVDGDLHTLLGDCIRRVLVRW